MKTRNVQIIRLQDWDALVNKTYGRTYSFQQQDDCKERGVTYFSVPDTAYEDYENDTVPEKVNDPDMGVSFAAWLARDPKQPLPDRKDSSGLELWWERNFYPSLGMVVNDLHSKGLLKEGEYGIDIDW